VFVFIILENKGTKIPENFSIKAGVLSWYLVHENKILINNDILNNNIMSTKILMISSKLKENKYISAIIKESQQFFI